MIRVPMTDAAINCPQCGSAFHAEEEGAFATCPFCGSKLHLGTTETIGHEILIPTLADAETPERLGRWLKEREVTAKPKELTTRLVWFPFWTLPEGALFPAAPLLASNVGNFRPPSGDRKAFREELTRSAEVVSASILAESLPLSDDERSTVHLLHLPFREVRFKLFGREYRIWIDAASGQVLAFELPPTSEQRLDVTYSVLLTLLFVVVLWGVRSLFGHGHGTLFGLALLVAAGPLFWLLARQAIRFSEER